MKRSLVNSEQRSEVEKMTSSKLNDIIEEEYEVIGSD
jgi:hypothetical protein